jgi:hypothetical protein
VHQNAAIAAIRNRIARYFKSRGFHRIDARLSCAGNRAALDPPAAALELQRVLAAADDLAIVDQDLTDTGELDEPAGIVRKQAVRSVDHEVGKLDAADIFGCEEMAFAGIDDPRRTGHATDARIVRQGQVGDPVGARRQEDRCVLARRLLDHLLQVTVLPVAALGNGAIPDRIDRATQVGLLRTNGSRSHGCRGGGQHAKQISSGDFAEIFLHIGAHAGNMPVEMSSFDAYPQKKNNRRSSKKRNLSDIVVLFTFPFKQPEGNARYFGKRFQL